MNDKLIHIAVASNHNYARGLNATLVSIVKATSDKRRLRFHVFDDGLEASDRNELQMLVKRFGYTQPIDFRSPDLQQVLSNLDTYHGAQTAYIRLFFPELLPDLDWVLWTDVDVLWFRDPSLLWDMQDANVSVLWSRDVRSTCIVAKKMSKWRPDRDVMHYACSGVMLMNLRKMRATNFIKTAMDFLAKWGSPCFADQDVLNEVCYEDSKFVDDRWDCMYPTNGIENGVVIHFNCIGPYFKDTKVRRFFPLFEIWFRFYAEVINGESGAAVASWWKRALYNVIAACYPLSRLLAPITDHIQPWTSDLIQRMFFFAWLRKKKLWK